MPQERTSYLLLLRNPSTAARQEAVRQLREMNVAVVAQFGGVAIEVLATRDQAEAIANLGMFGSRLRGPMKTEHLEKLSAEQRQIVAIWNARFAPSYRKLKDDDTNVGKAWSDEDRREPLPYTAIGPEAFIELVRKYEERTKKKLLPPEPKTKKGKPQRPMSAGCRRRTTSGSSRSVLLMPTRIPRSRITSRGCFNGWTVAMSPCCSGCRPSCCRRSSSFFSRRRAAAG